MIVNIRSKGLVLFLISATLYQAYGKDCLQTINNGEVTIKKQECLDELSSIIDSACDVFKKNLPLEKYKNLCQKSSVLKANSSQGWRASLDTLAAILAGKEIEDRNRKSVEPSFNDLSRAYEQYFKPYVISKISTSQMNSSFVSTTSTSVAEFASIAVQTDLDLHTLGRQYMTVEEQLAKIAVLSQTQDELKKRIRDLEQQVKDQNVDLGSKEKVIKESEIDRKNLELQKKRDKEMIENLEIKITQQSQKITQIQKEQVELKQKNDANDKDHRKKVEELKSKLKTNQGELSNLQDNLIKAKEEAQKATETTKKHAQDQEEVHKIQIAEQVELRDQLEKTNEELKKTILDLHLQLAKQQIDLDDRSHKISNMESEKASLQSQNKQFQKEIEELHRQISEKIEESKKVKREIFTLEANHNTLSQLQQEKLSALGNTLNQVESEKQTMERSLNQKIQALTEQIQKTRQDVQQQLQAQQAAHRKQLEEQGGLNGELRDKILKLEDISKEAQSENMRLNEKIVQFLSQIENGKIQTAALQTQVKSLLETVQQSKSKIQSLEQSLEEEKKAFEVERQNWEQERTQAIKALVDAVRNGDGENPEEIGHEVVTTALNQTKDLLDATKMVSDKIQSLSEEISGKKAEINKISEHNAQEKKVLLQQINSLEEAKKQLVQEKSIITQKEEKVKAENVELEKALIEHHKKYEEEVQRNIQSNAVTQEQKIALQKELDQNKQDFEKINETFKTLQADNTKTVEALETMRNKVKELSEKNGEYFKKVQEKYIKNRKLHKEIKEKDETIKRMVQDQEFNAQQHALQDLERQFSKLAFHERAQTFSEYLDNIRVALKEGLKNKFDQSSKARLYQSYQDMLDYMGRHPEINLEHTLPQDIQEIPGNYLTPEHIRALKEKLNTLRDQQKDARDLSQYLSDLFERSKKAEDFSQKLLLLQQYYRMNDDLTADRGLLEGQARMLEEMYLSHAIEWLNTPNLSEAQRAEQAKVLFEQGPEALRTLVKSHQTNANNEVERQNAAMEEIKHALSTQEVDPHNADALYDHVIQLTNAYHALEHMNTKEIQLYRQVLIEQIKITYQHLLDAAFNGAPLSEEHLKALQTIPFPEALSKEKITMYTTAYQTFLTRHMSQKEREIAENTQKEIVRNTVQSFREEARQEAKNAKVAQEHLTNLYNAYRSMSGNSAWFTPEEFQAITQELIEKYRHMIDWEIKSHQDTLIPEDILNTGVSDIAPQELKNFSEEKRQEMLEHNQMIRQHTDRAEESKRQNIVEEEKKAEISKLYQDANQEANTPDQAQENFTNLYKVYKEVRDYPQWFGSDALERVSQALAQRYTDMINMKLQAYQNYLIPQNVIASVTSLQDGPPALIELAGHARNAMVQRNEKIHQQMMHHESEKQQRIIEEHNNTARQEMVQVYNTLAQQYQEAIHQRAAEYGAAHQQMIEEHQEHTARQAEAASRATVAKLLAPFVPKALNQYAFAVSLQALREAYREMHRHPEYFTEFERSEIKQQFLSYYKKTLLNFIKNNKNKSVEIDNRLNNMLFINTDGLPQDMVSEITQFQNEMQSYVQAHNESLKNQNLVELFKTDWEFSNRAVPEHLEDISFSALLVALQGLFNISDLCTHYMKLLPDYTDALKQYKVHAEEKFKRGYMLMLQRAEAIYRERAPEMFIKDEEAIRQIKPPPSIENELNDYLDAFFQKVHSQRIELENSTTYHDTPSKSQREAIVEERKAQHLREHSSKNAPINIEEELMELEK